MHKQQQYVPPVMPDGYKILIIAHAKTPTMRKPTCPRIDKNKAGWKMDVIGRTGLSLSRGFERLMVMNDTDISIPRAVICRSPYLTPSRYSTDREYAEIKQFNARIWWEFDGRGAREGGTRDGNHVNIWSQKLYSELLGRLGQALIVLLCCFWHIRKEMLGLQQYISASLSWSHQHEVTIYAAKQKYGFRSKSANSKKK